MEDDDEFGDLYTDVLRPFAPTSSTAPQSFSAPPSATGSIDLNFQTHRLEILHGASHPNSAVPYQSSDQTGAPKRDDFVEESARAVASNSAPGLIGRDEIDERGPGKEDESVEAAKVIERGDAESAGRALQDVNRGKESGIGDVRREVAVKGDDLTDKDVKFDIEDDGDGIEEVGSEPIIPGLSSGAGGYIDGVVAAAGGEAAGRFNESGDRGEGDDWDSDSEDDLQIVLNNHMDMERGGMVGEDDEDEDSELVIVADGDPSQATEVQEWGENSAQPADSERKDMGDSAKASGGVTVVPKVGYSNHGYHPFHSQFKYVRPGAAPIPGASTAPGVSAGQIRPPANMVPMAGRGRGDWRPPGIKGAAALQKGFHAGPGLPVWGNSAAGRGFGGGLEFTLPSHKTIFDVDIDSFEEKPWKYPGVDTSDFFNFGLIEETWKEYCKQLEQLRLESTMQSKIRVYESGRMEQEYDPDLPPELAAATGMREVNAENTNSVKSDAGQSDVGKGSGRVRPPLPTGRAIQVEGGLGERLPSIDTRPPRIRDSDAIIEIVLQDSADDDSSAGIAVQDQYEGGEPQRDDFEEEDVVDEVPNVEHKYFDGFPQDYSSRKRDLAGKRMTFKKSPPADVLEGGETLPFSQEESVNCTSTRDQTPRPSGGNSVSSDVERYEEVLIICLSSKLIGLVFCIFTYLPSGVFYLQADRRKASSRITPSREINDNKKEDSDESMERRDNAHLSSPMAENARESSVGDKDANLDEPGTAGESSKIEKEEMDLNAEDKRDTLKSCDGKPEKLTSQDEEPVLDEVDDWENSRAARSSDNSKASSVRSRGYQKRLDGYEEEVVQDAQSARLGANRRPSDENEHDDLHRREHDGRQEPERDRLLPKGREESYPYKEWHPSSAHQLHMKADGFGRQKDRDGSDIAWARRDDDPYGRRGRNDEARKRDRVKVRENERSDRDDSLYSRKQLDNGSYRVPYDKDIGLRDSGYWEKDDGLKSRYEAMEDYHNKRRKDEEYLRREHIDKEDMLHGYRESGSRRRRERDVVLDPRKRNDLQRSRDNLDDHYASRQKDDGLLLKERSDRQRDKEEWHRAKQSHEEHPSKREREEGRSSVRSGRGAEEKSWVGHVRAQDEHRASVKEYQSRDATRPSEQVKRRDRIRDESPHHKGREDSYTRGNHYSSEEKRSRQERSSSRGDRAATVSDNQRVNEKRHKEGTRRSKESDLSDHNSLSKRNQEDQSGQTNRKSSRVSIEEGRTEQEGHHPSRKHREDISSDDEQHESRRGRSKLERWTSHKERDFSVTGKPSSSLKFKDIDKDNNDASSGVGKPVDESAKTVETVENQHNASAEGKDSIDMESKDADPKGSGDRHIDTVEKLKKRSERFKLPMPSEKEALTIKKLESEPLPSAKSENTVDSEVKQERPARKRRWISN
ncbi:FIP1[V]-like protein [Prosopis cineraria]|uniref:FIP1[V]-like protein n=1 Tax=Prosopis cineraria TaxID=364024 RepID=UPI00240EA8A1|nr:FIP1[V]-like protein [Prosopis cineraria]